MKSKISMLLICAVTYQFTFAQIEKGTILIGGMGGFSNSTSQNIYDDGTTSTTTDGPTYTSFYIAPWAGFLITEDLAIGLGINYRSYVTKSSFTYFGDITNTTDKTNTFTISPGARYYYVHTDVTHLWAQLSIPIGFGTTTHEEKTGTTTTSSESKIATFGVGISPGLTINISKRCGLEAQYGFLGYTSSKTTTDLNPGSNVDKTSSFALDWAGTFGFGIIFTL